MEWWSKKKLMEHHFSFLQHKVLAANAAQEA